MNKYKETKRGISLIVLVITILIMIILAGAIIITLSNTNIINKANKAKFLSTYKTLQEALTLEIANRYITNINNTSDDTTSISISNLAPNLSASEAEKFKIDDGKIVLTDKASPEEKGWVAEYEAEETATETDDSGAISISTVADLKNIANNPSGSYKLVNNINISAESWNAIPNFSGTLDGDGHTITIGSLNITRIDLDEETTLYVASLIGMSTGEIKNLKIAGNISISDTNNYDCTDPIYAATIAMYNMQGSVKDCCNTGNISISCPAEFGGIVCMNMGTIENSYNTGSITSTVDDVNIGGITCMAAMCTIKNSYNTGSISNTGTSDAYAAGISSSFGGGDGGEIIQSCYNTGSITVSAEECTAGGITRSNEAGVIVENCYNTGNISATGSYVVAAGISSSSRGAVQNCYNIGTISATGSQSMTKGSVVANNREDDGATMQRNYYLTGTADLGIGSEASDDASKVVAKSESDMKLESFVSLLNTGFESTTPWKYVNSSYPKLSWQQ